MAFIITFIALSVIETAVLLFFYYDYKKQVEVADDVIATVLGITGHNHIYSTGVAFADRMVKRLKKYWWIIVLILAICNFVTSTVLSAIYYIAF